MSVEAADPFHVGIGDHAHAVIADHAIGLVAPELPYGQPASLLVHVQEGLDEVHRAVRFQDREERVLRAEGVPQAEHGVHVVIRVMYLAVDATVLAVDIVEDVGDQQAVVKCCVEDALLFARSALHLDPSERGLPFLLRLPAHGIEVPTRHFGIQVLPRALDAHCADAHLDHQWLAAGVAEEEHRAVSGIGPVDPAEHAIRALVAHHVVLHLAVEADAVEQVLITRP